MSKSAASMLAVVVLALWPASTFADPPEDNPGQPFEEIEAKLDELGADTEELDGKLDDLSMEIEDLDLKLDDLAALLAVLQSSLDLIEAKLDVDMPESCPSEPELLAAITKQIEELDPPDTEVCAVRVEIKTLTNAPFKPIAMSVMTPDQVVVLTGPTTSCNSTVNDKFLCAHNMRFEYDSTASGPYELELEYECDPAPDSCDACGSEVSINFSLATSSCSVFEVPP